jgi:hypothetical protein
MAFSVKIHFDNSSSFAAPHVWIWYDGSVATQDDFAATDNDTFGPIFEVQPKRKDFNFKFKQGAGIGGPWERERFDRRFEALAVSAAGAVQPSDIWAVGANAFVYPVQPRAPERETAAEFISPLPKKPGVYVPDTGGLSGLGTIPLSDARTLFGLYQPNAARVYVMGSFNDWQRPGADNEDSSKFLECKRYCGYFGVPNTWLLVTDKAQVGDEYKFFTIGGVPRDRNKRFQKYFPDPYSRGASQ